MDTPGPRGTIKTPKVAENQDFYVQGNPKKSTKKFLLISRSLVRIQQGSPALGTATAVQLAVAEEFAGLRPTALVPFQT